MEHLVEQMGRAVEVGITGGTGVGGIGGMFAGEDVGDGGRGGHNGFWSGKLRARLAGLGVEVVVPDAAIVDYKEALVMALIGVLRWREENNVLASVRGRAGIVSGERFNGG